jgi:hypothetical protein
MPKAADSAQSPPGRAGGRRRYIIPLAPDQALPRMPAEGLRSEEEIARVPEHEGSTRWRA